MTMATNPSASSVTADLRDASALRRSVSASCLLRPKHSLSDNDLKRRGSTSATVLTVRRLPPYCADRLYLLSELEVHAHAIRFLREGEAEGTEGALPPSVLLYLLWDPAAHPTPRSFAQGPLSDGVRWCLLANGDDPSASPPPDRSRDGSQVAREWETPQLLNIYVVVDRLPNHSTDQDLGSESFPESSSKGATEMQPLPSKEEKQQRLLLRHDGEVKMAEQLARTVASSQFLRSRIDGLSVGVTSNDRAAPGLEACMDAVARGAKERRKATKILPQGDIGTEVEGALPTRKRRRALGRLREKSPERSPIAFAALRYEDLHHESMDHHDHAHHHHHGEDDENDFDAPILQCRVSIEWSGNGEHSTFADRAMEDWRRVWRGASESSASGGRSHSGTHRRPRVPRIAGRGKRGAAEEEDVAAAEEPLSTAMVVVFLAVVAAYAWQWFLSWRDGVQEES